MSEFYQISLTYKQTAFDYSRYISFIQWFQKRKPNIVIYRSVWLRPLLVLMAGHYDSLPSFCWYSLFKRFPSNYLFYCLLFSHQLLFCTILLILRCLCFLNETKYTKGNQTTMYYNVDKTPMLIKTHIEYVLWWCDWWNYCLIDE